MPATMNRIATVRLVSVWLASSVPYSSEVKAVPLRKKPTISSGRRCVLRSLGTMLATAIKAAIPNGTLIRKIQCQEKYVVMNPPREGPTTGATIAGQVIVEIRSEEHTSELQSRF